MKTDELELRKAIIAKAQFMNASGLNQGTSGNISARLGGEMLITPSATPYEDLKPQMIAAMALDDPDGAWRGPLKPSTEWRFHRDILNARPDVGAVVHTHSTYATTLSILRRDIPACHYMIAAFGGADVRCSGYARYGTARLSELVLEALTGREGCLLANHGMIALGETLDKAMWRAVELETIARQYYLALAVGAPVILSDAEVREAAEGFKSYGLKAAGKEAPGAGAGARRRRGR